MIRRDRVMEFKGKKIYYNHEINGSYDLLIIGKPNEPETHCFFERVIPYLQECNFIDVGASVGEMIIGVSLFANIDKIFAFEPRKDCFEAIHKTLKLNDEKRVLLKNMLIGEKKRLVEFNCDPSGSGSGVYKRSDFCETTVTLMQSTLDIELPKLLINSIFLVDVEGYEVNVLSGSREFIVNNKPLIIFEYNDISKKYFNLNDVRQVLPQNYCVYRLREKGYLDSDFSDSWNCVAFAKDTPFEKICKNIII